MASAGPASLIAQFRLNSELVQAMLGLTAVIFLGVLVLLWFNRWRRRAAAPPTPDDELKHYRSLYEQGLMSHEEFERLRAHLDAQLRKSLGVSKPAPPPEGPSANGAGS